MKPGTIVDEKYTVLQELGRGSMGVVYAAQDCFLDREVALKVIPASLVTPSSLQRFRKEAKALASIRNQHVVQVYSFGSHEGGPFFAMEFVHGRDLASLINEYNHHGSFIPVVRGLTLLRQITEGLAAVHAAGILHRDIKPENVVIEDRTGRPVLIDFGLAERDDGLTAEIAGTPAYMAPEQTRGGPLSVASDLYALGCVAYEIFTGWVPFEAPSIEALFRLHQRKLPPPASSRRSGLEPLNLILLRLLAKEPGARYASCTEFLQALRVAEASMPRPSVVSRPSPPVAQVLPPTPPPETPTISGDQGPPQKPLEVLIVDDDVAFRRFATRCVQLAFYQQPLRVRSVDSGDEGVTAARQQMPDFILLDYAMRGLDGIETLTLLRALPQGSSSRVVVVSASTGQIEKWRFGVLGVQDFIEKPVPFALLVDLIQKIGKSAGWLLPSPA